MLSLEIKFKIWKSFFKLIIMVGVYFATDYGGVALAIPVSLIMASFYMWYEDEYCGLLPNESIENRPSNCEIFVESTSKAKSDSVEWINLILKELWLNYRTYFNSLFRDKIWPLILEELKNKPGLIGTIELQDFHIGDQAPTISSIESWIENTDLILDVGGCYDGNAYISIALDETVLKIPVVIKDVKVYDAQMRFVLKNWTPQLPIISGIQFSFIEPPTYDCSISKLEGIADIPGFDELVMHIVNVKLMKRVVLPRMLLLPVSLPISQVMKLRKHFPIKTQFNCKALMLTPLLLIRVRLEEIDYNPDKNYLSCRCSSSLKKRPGRATICMGDQTHSISSKDYPKNLTFEVVFPVEHVHKQKVEVTIFDESGALIGKVTELVSNIRDAKEIHDWYRFENKGGGVKISLEAIPISNKRQDLAPSTQLRQPYGVLSIFLGELKGPAGMKPTVYLNMHQNKPGKIDEWTSLEPLSSRKTTKIYEGTLMLVADVNEESSYLEVKVWNGNAREWIGKPHKVDMKDMLTEPLKDLDLTLDEDIQLSMSVSLYQISQRARSNHPNISKDNNK